MVQQAASDSLLCRVYLLRIAVGGGIRIAMGFIDESELDPPATGGRFLSMEELDPRPDEGPAFEPYEGPSFFSDPVGALTSADWWLTRPSGERITAKQAVAGPALAVNNALNPFGDETVAAGNALLDDLYSGIGKFTGLYDAPAGDYEARLREARGLEGEFREPAGLGVTVPLDLTSALKMPFPNVMSQAKGTQAALGNIGKGAGLGAGYGALFGFGSGEGDIESRTASAGEGGLLGALLGGTLQGGIEGAQGASRFVRELLGGLTPNAKAASLLDEAAGPKIRTTNLSPTDRDPFFQGRTLAEELQDPRLASLQQGLTDRSRAANAALVTNEADRRSTHLGLLQSLSPEPPKSAEVAGSELRNIIKAESDRVFDEAINKGIPLQDQGQLVPFKELRSRLNSIASNEYKAGGLPGGLSSIVNEVNKTVKLGDVIAKPKLKPFDYIHDLRERAQQAWLDAKLGGDAKGARVASDFVKSIDDAIVGAPNKAGTLTPENVERFLSSKQAYSDAASIYKEGKLGASLNSIKADEFRSKGSEIIEKYFDGTPEGTKQLLKALPDDEKSLDIARGAIRDHIRRSTQTNDELLAPETFRRFVRENKEALSAEANGRRLFEPEHLSTLEQIADDLALIGNRSVKSVRSMANRSSAGQSSTAQRLALNHFADLAAKIPGLSHYKAWLQEGVDKVLTQALIRDKGFAQQLLKPATPGRVTALAKTLQSKPTAGAITETSQNALRTSRDQEKSQQREELAYRNPTRSFIDGAIEKAEAKMSNKVETPKPLKTQRVAGRGNEVSTALVRAIISKESSGNRKAVSPKGARGLMQIMPATAREIADDLGYATYDLEDPETNQKFGTHYIGKMLKLYDGDLELALAAYNAGQGRLDRWRKKYGPTWSEISQKLKENGIFKETRDYVPKVIWLMKKNGQVKA